MSKAIAPLAFGTKTALASQAQCDRIICAVRVLVKGENLRQKNQERGQCMPRGRVKFFNYAKSFGGFVIPDAGPDICLWSEAVREAKLKNIKSLDRVEFEVGRHPITGRRCVVKVAAISEDWQEAPDWFRKEALAE